ncbi:hypothetical protein [Pedobacter sp. NJ-S-72]
MNIIIRLREKYAALLRDKQIPLMQSRIRILTFGLILMLALLFIISINSLIKSDFKTGLRLLASIGAMSAGLYFLLEKSNWRLAGHLFLLALCSIIWTNIILYSFGINLVTLQLSLIIISASFYILGKNWGIVFIH